MDEDLQVQGCENIGPLGEQLKEARKELAMVRHVERSQQAKLQERKRASQIAATATGTT